MKISNARIFPYPVLASMYDDYFDCFFSVDVKAKQGKRQLYIEATPSIKCNTLEKLIQNYQAEVVMHLECARTRYRTTSPLKINETNKIEIPSGEINENLEVVAFIVSKVDIKSFRCVNNEFNSDYGNASFDIETGSILAISEQKEIPIQKNIYDLSNVNSIVSITSRQEDDDSQNIDITLTDEKIRVSLPKETYINYSGIGKTENKKTPIVHALFAFPALVYTIDYLKEIGEDHWIDVENNLWFKVIKKKIEERYGKFDMKIIDNYKSVIIAQELIESPFPVAVQTLLGMEDK